MVKYKHKMSIEDLKKQKSRSLYVLAAIVLLAILWHPAVVGQTTDELSELKQEKQKQLNEILQRISSLQAEIKQRRSLASSLKNDIAIIDLEIAETEAQILATREKIDVTNLEIAEVTASIVQTEADIDQQKEVLKKLIAQIYDLDQRSPLEIALEHDNFTDFLNQLQYATSIQEISQETLTKIKLLKQELELRQSALKKQKSDLDILQRQYELAEAGLNGQRLAKQQILDETRGQEQAYQRLLAESEGLEEQIAREIFDLEVELRKRLGDSRVPAQKGLLAWPMDGILTQGYGNTGFTSLGYTFHNGIDLAAAAGTPIYSAGDGVVLHTGTGGGAYGNWVTIKHTLGKATLIGLYAHMSSFNVNPGQVLLAGDLVGFEGNTGNTTRLLYGPHRGYHLHFTLFDVQGYGVAEGKFPNIYGPYRVPYGATYNPLEFL